MSIVSSKRVWAIGGVILLCALCFVGGMLVGHDKAITSEVAPMLQANRTHFTGLDDQIKNLNARIDQQQKIINELMNNIKHAISENTIRGVASWYGKGDGCGLVTATGEAFDINKFTVAHKTLPLGTYVIVRNKKTGKQAFGIINDRGPYIKGRDFDLSWSLAVYLGFEKQGITQVEVILLGKRQA